MASIESRSSEDVSDNPIREGCAVYIALFSWGALVIGALNIWGPEAFDSPWLGLAILCPVALAWIAVWVARRTDKEES